MHARKEALPSPESPSARAFFDSGAGGYDALHYGAGVRSFMTVRLARVLALVDALQLPAGKVAIEAGCGPGYLAEALAARGLRVHGLDASPAMLRRARERVEQHAAAAPAFAVGDVERLPFRDRSVDLVCSTGVLEYLPEDAPMLAEIRRILRPGGHAVLTVTNDASPVGWLDFAVEAAKRRPMLARALEALRPGHEVRARHFAVRRHRPAAFRGSIVAAGLTVERDAWFYLLPWPHPFDQLFPRLTARLNRRLEPHADSRLGPLAEGYAVVARRGG